MNILDISNDFKVDESLLISTSKNFAHKFNESEPCKHIKFENFVNKEILEKVLNDFKTIKKESFTGYERKPEKNKKVHSPYDLSHFTISFFKFDIPFLLTIDVFFFNLTIPFFFNRLFYSFEEYFILYFVRFI